MEPNNVEKDELNLDLNKLTKIVTHRAPWSLACYVIAIVLAFVITPFMTKIYISDAALLINKGEDTNLAEINPFVVGESSAAVGGMSSLLSMGSASSGNELDILKSPLVMNRVIRENNLIYRSGPKKGKYINGSAFAASKDLKIESKKASKTIEISYKSPDRKFAYNIVKSIIKNYIEVYESINSSKAMSDKEFLTKSYMEAKNDLDQKVAKFKEIDAIYSNSGTGGVSVLMGVYNKKLNRELNTIAQEGLNLKKVEIELEQSVEKVRKIKERLEWINLVESLSKSLANITILKEPELKESFEYSKPDIKINVIVAFVLAIIISSFLVMGMEITSKKLTYSNMDIDTLLIHKGQIDLSNLKAKTIIHNIKNLAIVSMANIDKSNNYIDMIKKELANNNVNIVLTTEDNILDEHIKNIMSSEYLVLIGQLGYTDRKPFNQLKDICKELKKDIINTYLVV